MGARVGGRSPAERVVEAGVHTPGLLRRHADRVLPVHELIAVQSGVLPMAEDGRRFAVRRDQWLLLRAEHHHYGYEDLDDATWFYWVCFGRGASDADGLAAAVLGGPRTGATARPDRLRSLFEHLLEDQEATILTPSATRGYLQLVLAEILLERPAVTSGTASDELARRAAAFMVDHLTDPDLSTAGIADALAFNADYLGRAYRAAFGETLTEHIHRLRVERARMLFRSTGWPIERVASEVGFRDERYFRRVFKRRVGLTPGEFQRLRPTSTRAHSLERPVDRGRR